MYIAMPSTAKPNTPRTYLNQVKQQALTTKSPQDKFSWLLIQAMLEGAVAQPEQADLKKAA